MKPKETLFDWLQSLVMKCIFTVGLCTSGYWSLAKMHQVLNPNLKTNGGHSVVDHSNVKTLERESGEAGWGTARALDRTRFKTGRESSRLKNQASEAHSETPAAVAAVAASPSPGGAEASPSPGAGGSENVSSQALVQGQEGTFDALPPAVYPMPVYPFSGAEPESDGNRNASESVSGRSADAGLNVLGGPLQGGMPASTPSGPVRGRVDLAQGFWSGSDSKSNLSASDIQLLLSGSIKASVPNSQVEVGGKSQEGTPLPPNTLVSLTRWSLKEGVKSEAGFVVRPHSGSIPVWFEVEMKLLSYNQGVEQPIRLSVKPEEASVQSEVLNGKPAKVFYFKMADVPLNYEQETATQLQARLVYELENGSYRLADGMFGFVRKEVKTNTQPWDSSRQPASNEPWIVVDHFPWSIKLEKSP